MKRTRVTYGHWAVNALTALCLILTSAVVATAAHLFVNPQSRLNPFPPPPGYAASSISLLEGITQSLGSTGALGSPGSDTNSGESPPLAPLAIDIDQYDRPSETPDPGNDITNPTPDSTSASGQPSPNGQVSPTGSIAGAAHASSTASPPAEVSNTPGLSSTPPPNSTPRPSNTPQSSSSLPKCTSHDPNKYHSLVNSSGTCHYDHTHNENPATSRLNGLFRNTFGSQSIGYPWQTPNENLNKHQAYKYATWPEHEAPAGECVQYLSPSNQLEQTYCVTDFLLQYHASTAFGMGTRFHSFAGCFSLDVNPNLDGDKGEACFGGWTDYLKLMLPYKDEDGDLINLEPLNPRAREVVYGFLQNPYLAARPYNSCTSNPDRVRTVENDLRDLRGIDHAWSNEGNTGLYGQSVQFSFTGRDAWGGVCPDDPKQIIFPQEMGLAPCPECNNSQARVYSIVIYIPDLNNDGSRVQLEGYTDLMGKIDSSCSNTSANCVPTFIDAIPGVYRFRIPIGDINMDISEFANLYEYDLSPPGERWIEYPN